MSDAAIGQHPERVEEQAEKIRDLLQREIRILREMLENLRQEQHALLQSDSERVGAIVHLRDPLINDLLTSRQRRQESFAQLQRLFPGARGQVALLDMLADHGSLSCEIALLRDQIMELLQQLEVQCERNNYLIRHRVAMGRSLIEALHPAKVPSTYNQDGSRGPKAKTATVAIINHEG